MSKKVFKRDLGSLEELAIRGLGVIDEATIEFKPGLNVITGETGAGKTMVLTALSLILGGKSEPQLVRHDAQRVLASGRFSLSDKAKLAIREELENLGAEIEDGSILLTRQVTKDGKSRASIGGASSTASLLSEIGSQLIAVHGQHASLQLSKSAHQREHLDSFGGESLQKALSSFTELRIELLQLRKRINELSKALQSRDRELQDLQVLVKDYEKVKPRANELEELDTLISRLGSVESLREASSTALAALEDETGGVLSALGLARRSLTTNQGKDRDLDAIADQISDSFFSLSDAASSLNRYLENLNADPGALNFAQERKALLLSFAKKHGAGDLDEAAIRARGAASKIGDLQGGDETLHQLQSEHSSLFEQVKKSLHELSSQRKSAATLLGKEVSKELAALSMPNGRFEIRVTTEEIDEKSDIKESGADEVEMLFSSHGGNLLPISKAASGGELSRLLLAIELTLAGRNRLETYVFDEVDAGIGGKAALEVGKRLRQLADDAQVIVVTHLPQVALWADHHVVVEKSENGAVTSSALRIVDGEERESEIARMLSGLEESEHAQDHARELLELRNLHFR